MEDLHRETLPQEEKEGFPEHNEGHGKKGKEKMRNTSGKEEQMAVPSWPSHSLQVNLFASRTVTIRKENQVQGLLWTINAMQE